MSIVFLVWSHCWNLEYLSQQWNLNGSRIAEALVKLWKISVKLPLNISDTVTSAPFLLANFVQEAPSTCLPTSAPTSQWTWEIIFPICLLMAFTMSIILRTWVATCVSTGGDYHILRRCPPSGLLKSVVAWHVKSWIWSIPSCVGGCPEDSTGMLTRSDGLPLMLVWLGAARKLSETGSTSRPITSGTHLIWSAQCCMSWGTNSFTEHLTIWGALTLAEGIVQRGRKLWNWSWPFSQ